MEQQSKERSQKWYIRPSDTPSEGKILNLPDFDHDDPYAKEHKSKWLDKALMATLAVELSLIVVLLYLSVINTCSN